MYKLVQTVPLNLTPPLKDCVFARGYTWGCTCTLSTPVYTYAYRRKSVFYLKLPALSAVTAKLLMRQAVYSHEAFAVLDGCWFDTLSSTVDCASTSIIIVAPITATTNAKQNFLHILMNYR